MKDIYGAYLWSISHTIRKTIPTSTSIVNIRKGVFNFELEGKSIKTETTTWLDFLNGWKAKTEQMLTSEAWNKSKKARAKIRIRDPSRKNNNIDEDLI